MTKSLAILVAGVLVVAVAGCRRETHSNTHAALQVLRYGNGGEPKDIDPQTESLEIEYKIDCALFEGLVQIANDGKTILPGVARRWEISPDGRDYTFFLRRNARWSDGSSVTAGDFVAGFRRAFDPKLACAGAVYGFAIRGARAFASGKSTDAGTVGITAPDPYTLHLSLDYRVPYMLYLLAGSPFLPAPRETLRRFGAERSTSTLWTRPGNLVSNGPFRLTSWKPNAILVAEKNPYYWGAKAVLLGEIRFYPNDDPAAMERAFRSGDLHVTSALPSTKILPYAERSDRRLHVNPQLDTRFIAFNTQRPPFDNPFVRRAFSLAINRDFLIPRILKAGGTAAHSATRPGTDGYTPKPAVDYDPKAARAMLSEAGFADRSRFPHTTLKLQAGQPPELAEALQEAWQRELGIHVSLQTEDEKTLYSDAAAGTYEMASLAFFYGINAPETVLVAFLSDSQWNSAHWRSPAFDTAYAQTVAAETRSDRFSGIDRMEEIIREEAPISPLYFSNEAYLVSPEVKGWKDNPLGQIDWRALSLVPVR